MLFISCFLLGAIVGFTTIFELRLAKKRKDDLIYHLEEIERINNAVKERVYGIED